MEPQSLDSYSIKDLACACAHRASLQRAPLPGEADPCYELFCRAFAPSPDDDAWQAILDQYRKLVRRWLGQYADDDTVQEAFARFWRTQQNAPIPFASRFPDIAAVMQYLKRCAIAVRIETWRAEERQRKLWDRLCDLALPELVLQRAPLEQRNADAALRQLVLSRLNENERLVFELTYHYALTPREIHVARPDLFPDVKAVHRLKENMLKRLRRDRDLREWWANRCEKDDGGKMASRPV